ALIFAPSLPPASWARPWWHTRWRLPSSKSSVGTRCRRCDATTTPIRTTSSGSRLGTPAQSSTMTTLRPSVFNPIAAADRPTVSLGDRSYDILVQKGLLDRLGKELTPLGVGP